MPFIYKIQCRPGCFPGKTAESRPLHFFYDVLATPQIAGSTDVSMQGIV
jgi:hypothetical protein